MNSAVVQSPRTAEVCSEDVQAHADLRQITIDAVGIKGLRYPVRIRDQRGEIQHTVAELTLTVNLASEQKGAHLSRLIQLLDNQPIECSSTALRRTAKLMVKKMEADRGRLEILFPYFLEKRAPVSGERSLMDYQVSVVVDVVRSQVEMTTQVCVPVTSLCPCSKRISERGAHNQRSHITLWVKCGEFLLIDDLIALAEGEASAPLYALLKRGDEKHVTEHAYDNPKFVEDTVRDIAARLVQDSRITHYVVECENFESIHNHSAYARIDGVVPKKRSSAPPV